MSKESKMQSAKGDCATTDGVQCYTCNKQLTFDSANTTKAESKKLASDKRAVWECSACQSAPGCHQITMQNVQKKISELRRQLTVLPTLIEAVKIIKDELQVLRTRCVNNIYLIEQLSRRLAGLEKQVTYLEKLKTIVFLLQAYVESLRFPRYGLAGARHNDKIIRKLLRNIRD